MKKIKDTLHKHLRIPYRLTITHDSKNGTPVIFLHGIASSSITWRNVIPLVSDTHRAITLDLLGFGDSPKPDWQEYTLDEHAAAVIRTIKSLRLKQPVLLVGHSMGSLIAVAVAKKSPNLIERLILCSPPIYLSDDMQKLYEDNRSSDRYINNVYFKIYEAIRNSPEFTLKSAQRIMSYAADATSFRLDENTWYSFQKSLKNSIESQTTYVDLLETSTPVDCIYGSLDVFVSGKYLRQIATKNSNVCVHKILAQHEISESYAKKVVQIIG